MTSLLKISPILSLVVQPSFFVDPKGIDGNSSFFIRFHPDQIAGSKAWGRAMRGAFGQEPPSRLSGVYQAGAAEPQDGPGADWMLQIRFTYGWQNLANA